VEQPSPAPAPLPIGLERRLRARVASGELFAMWSSTRMVVLTAMSASLYAAILIPFKVIPIIPGVTELRPANAVPVVCSFLFGPAAAWGAAIGNVIGDFFGGLGPGDVFGCAANLLYGLAPYRIWRALGGDRPVPVSVKDWLRFGVSVFGGAAVCALVVGWGLNLLGFIPFTVLGNIVLVNNMVAAGILAPLILRLLHPRVARARLLYSDVFPTRPRGRVRGAVGLALFFSGAVGGLVAGNLAAAGRWQPSWVAASRSPTRAVEVGFGVAPFVAAATAGLALL
jgi:energy-coupling factor transport system substrate-specific component